ncbi:MAG: alfa-L-rhamnosidase, partial [Oscillibacter sp.]|nr:alfa-L-rhamnosidase [Oscillibacter sp.]
MAVRSHLRRTGFLSCSDENLNRLFSNILWGQKDNFLDVPTDCPQRDERLGWTGDEQVFVKTASYQFDVERFFRKWLRDLAACQRPDGGVGHVVPDYLPENPPCTGWGDAAVICPWQIYETYGDPAVLEEQFNSMRQWIDYITSVTTTPDLWTGSFHYGDWLGLDAPQGSYKGSSRDDFLASAFYAWSTHLLVRAGNVLGRDVSDYAALYQRIVSAFRRTFPTYETQTECVLAAWFGLAADRQGAADRLAELIRENGGKLATGFLGTPYLL